MDLGIINGYVYLEGRFIKSNLYIKNGVIESVTSSIMHCSKVYDAKGCIIMPGFIDPHVHFNLGVGKNVSAQDFHTGSINAALGGITTYIDFLDPINNISELDFEFNKRKKQAEDSVIDYGFHVTLGSFKEDVKELFKKGRALGMPTIKIFTTYESTGRMTKDNIIDELLKYSKEYECRVVVHAENNDLIKEKNILVKDHEKARPAIAEISEVLKLCEIAAYRNGLLYIVHTNCGTTVERVRENFKDSLHSSIILESAPHYFKFNSSVYEGEDGYRYTMTPPLREESERLKLKDKVYLNMAEKFSWPDANLSLISEDVFCHGLRDQIGILLDGTVVPCCLDSEGKIPLGNIFDKSLEQIITSERARNIYDGFSRRRAVEDLCKRCGYAKRNFK